MPLVPSRILGSDGKPLMREVPPIRPRALFDAAGSGTDNRRHWAQADLLSARSANSKDVREKLRARARYEFGNNGYCNGLIVTLANDLIGTGPSLQVLLEFEAANDQVESRFAEWADSIGLAEKLHTAKQAKTRDGEALLLLRTNNRAADPVKLDLRPLECDHLTSPWGDFGDDTTADGIEFDGDGNPTRYHILDEHPGDSYSFTRDGTWVQAERVIHWFRCDRPGQCRGVPEITPALNLFAQMRRYTLATLSAAEIAADFAALLKSSAPPDGSAQNTDDPFSEYEISRGMMTQLPEGWEMQQFHPEQPVTTYEMFKREILKEMGRCANAPFNVIAGDSSLYNYSSARLDHLLYRGALLVERDHCRRNVMERVFSAWLAEGRLVAGYLPAGLSDVPHTWYWPGFATIDPLKEAQADEKNLRNFTTTLKELAAESRKDWKAVMYQAAAERKLMRELGLDVEPLAERIRTEPQEVVDEEGNPPEKDEGAPKSSLNGFHRNGRAH